MRCDTIGSLDDRLHDVNQQLLGGDLANLETLECAFMTTLIGEQITSLSLIESRLYFSNQLKEIGFIEIAKLETSNTSRFTKNVAHSDQISKIMQLDSQHLLTVSEDRTVRILDKNTSKTITSSSEYA